MKKIIMTVVLGLALAFRAGPNDKIKVTLSLSIPEWQAVITSIASSDALSAKSAAAINNDIIQQVQAQMPKPDSSKKADSTSKKKP